MKLLIVEDDDLMRATLKAVYKEHELHWAGSVAEALQCLENDVFGAAFLDINLKKGTAGDGIDLLRTIRQKDSYLPCIMISAISKPQTIVECLNAGAVDYVVKGSGNADTYRIALYKALAWRKMLAESQSSRTPAAQATSEIRGHSVAVTELKKTLDRMGSLDGPFLILGETGTGKELVARALWASHQDYNRPFIALNCASLPENLVESELFGYERGAFTGALNTKTGLFEAANGGDIFLDEIGEVSKDLQAKLLRVLQEKRVRRVGSDKERPVNFRVIAATNVHLLSAVEEGDFRDDLFYRLNVHQVRVPPLRERREDITELFSIFMRECGISGVTFEPKAEQEIMNFMWPGNIRQLKGFAQALIPYLDQTQRIVTHEQVARWMTMNTVKSKLPAHQVSINPENELRQALGQKTTVDVLSKMNQFQRAYIDAALQLTENNRSQAARLLGISRQRLSNWLNEWPLA